MANDDLLPRLSSLLTAGASVDAELIAEIIDTIKRLHSVISVLLPFHADDLPSDVDELRDLLDRIAAQLAAGDIEVGPLHAALHEAKLAERTNEHLIKVQAAEIERLRAELSDTQRSVANLLARLYLGREVD